MSAFDTALSAMAGSLNATFGQSLTYTPAAGVARAVTGIISDPTRADDVWPGMYHGLTVRVSDFATAPAQNDEVTIGTDDYTVFDVKRRGPWYDLALAKK